MSRRPAVRNPKPRAASASWCELSPRSRRTPSTAPKPAAGATSARSRKLACRRTIRSPNRASRSPALAIAARLAPVLVAKAPFAELEALIELAERSVRIGDTLTVTVTCKRKFDHNDHIIFDCHCRNQDGEQVIHGTAEVIAPKEKVRRLKIDLPDVRFDDKEARFREVMGRVRARKLTPVATAIVDPADADVLAGVAAAAADGALGLVGGHGDDALPRRSDPGEHDPRGVE